MMARLPAASTEVTTAHLTCAVDDRYYEIERLHGAEGARFVAESHAAAIHRIEAIAAKEEIDCDFERLDGYLFLSPKALYWDTGPISQEGHPVAYHYVRLQTMAGDAGEYDLLIVGGEDHKTGQADDTPKRHARLETWARERFPMMEDIEFTWGGQCMETDRRPGVHRPQSAGQGQRVHRHRRLRHGHDARHDRRHAADRPDPRPREPLGDALRPLAQDRCARPAPSSRRTSTSPRSTWTG